MYPHLGEGIPLGKLSTEVELLGRWWSIRLARVRGTNQNLFESDSENEITEFIVMDSLEETNSQTVPLPD